MVHSSHKCGSGANWLGTSGGAEDDMLNELLAEANSEGFGISQAMNKVFQNDGFSMVLEYLTQRIIA